MTRGIHLTPEILEAAYNLLCKTPPFKRWKLPDAESIEFRTIRLPNNDQGECWVKADKTLCLTVNPLRHHTLASAILTLAHELVHVREWQLKVKDVSHGKTFVRLADHVCRRHGFDRGQF